VLEVSAQQLKTNYFGRIIVRVVKKIPRGYITESRKENFPTVLVIGPKQYLSQIAEFLEGAGLVIDYHESSKETSKIVHAMALPFLKEEPDSNIGWRIALEADNPDFTLEVLKKSLAFQVRLSDELELKYKKVLLEEATKWQPVEEIAEKQVPPEQPTIKL